ANGFELWYSQASAFDTTAVRIGQLPFVNSGSNATFDIALPISSGVTTYFFLTVNVKSSPTVGHTVQVTSFTPSANITLADAGTVTGTATAAGVQTIDACTNYG